MTQALVLVDIQNDYFPGGTMELVGMDSAGDNARSVLESFRERKAPLYHIQHLSVRPGATFFVPETNGANHHASVLPAAQEVVIQKNFPNAFRATDLEQQLRDAQIEQLVIVGAMSHMCIDATTRAAFDLGFECTVVEDACATRNLEFNGKTVAAEQVHGSFMAALAAPYATVVSTAAYLNG
jgi:nicotinamidase-related amidase